LEEHPEMTNTHKYYDMTGEEKQHFWMKKMHYMWFKMPKDRRQLYFKFGSNLRFVWYFMF